MRISGIRMTKEQDPILAKKYTGLIGVQILSIVLIILGVLELLYVHNWYGVFGLIVGFGLAAFTLYKQKDL